MRQQTTQTLTAPADAKTRSPLARKIIIAALVIHFVALFLPFTEEATVADHPIAWNVGLPNAGIVTPSHTTPELRGFQLHHWAIFIIIGLLIVFLTNIHRSPFWQRWGYWLSFVLLLIFAFGPSIITTSGGKFSLLSMGLVFLAAVINLIASKQTPTAKARS